MTTREEIVETEHSEALYESRYGPIKCDHNYVDDVMPESGVDYPVKVCTKCGDWR
jgi:hypothetical protein